MAVITNTGTTETGKPALIPPGIRYAFFLLASCFAWWGLANNMTDPLVSAFKDIFSNMSTFTAALIQFAFYGAYFCLAIPGAIISRKYGYKAGVLIGLGFYAMGCCLLIPAAEFRIFGLFLLSYFVLAGGLSILETAANPYMLALGSEQTATQRLNLAQSFNPVGSVIGNIMAQILILAKLREIDVADEVKATMAPEALAALQEQQLSIAIQPYLMVAAVLVIVWFLILFCKMPVARDEDHKAHFLETFARLSRNGNWVFAVIAQFFYVAAQICVWTYTFMYIPEAIGVTADRAANMHMYALILFGVMRFVCTWLMGIIAPHRLLLIAAVIAGLLTLNVMFVGGMVGVISLILISGCMSLMFPTIFGLGSRGLGSDRKIGGSGLIMAIIGAAILTPVQGHIIDLTNIPISYVVPLVCFIVIAAYAIYAPKANLPDNVEVLVKE